MTEAKVAHGWEHTNKKIYICPHISKEELTSTEAVSSSSTKNVLWPAIIWSLAPIRTKIRSTRESSRFSAGTSAPIWQRIWNQLPWTSNADIVIHMIEMVDYLSQYNGKTNLAQESWFTTHIWTSKNNKAGIPWPTYLNIIWYKWTLA